MARRFQACGLPGQRAASTKAGLVVYGVGPLVLRGRENQGSRKEVWPRAQREWDWENPAAYRGGHTAALSYEELNVLIPWLDQLARTFKLTAEEFHRWLKHLTPSSTVGGCRVAPSGIPPRSGRRRVCVEISDCGTTR